MVEGVGVHLDGFVDGLWARGGGSVAEGFEEALFPHRGLHEHSFDRRRDSVGGKKEKKEEGLERLTACVS